MLVYANNFYLEGEQQEEIAFRTIGGWLKRTANIHLSPAELKSGNEYSEGIYTVRIYAADKREPYIYSILLTHKDEKISGRSWATEISVRQEKEKIFISILLQTQEQSTQVDIAPEATRPLLVSYLRDNCSFAANTPGLRIKQLDGGENQEAEYKSLLYEIERPSRDYPLVLVSCADREPPLQPEKLQDQLFGLAQVVFIKAECNSWEMERILGRTYSVWGGAINIISPFYAEKGFCYTNLLLQAELQDIGKTQNLPHYILSLITHRTNLTKKRFHFSPADVRAKRQKDYLLYLRESSRLEGKNDKERAEEYCKLFEAACEETKKLEEQIEQLQTDKNAADLTAIQYLEEKEVAEKKLKNKKYQIESLQRRTEADSHNTDITEAILALAGKRGLTPRLCLELAERQNRDIIVLESALKSAEKAGRFKNTQKLLDALYRLGNEYLPAYLAGGDNTALDVFGSSIYSARESDLTMQKYPHSRDFNYKGKPLPMWQHLRFGVADNEEEMLRLHFAVADGKIIIGHCGAHLPISSV